MTRSITQQDVSWFLDLKDKGQLNLDPPYQRKSVWTQNDKRFFIDTVLNDYPAPPVFLHKSLDDGGRSTYHVVDGKQRLTTIIDFAAGKIRISEDFPDVSLQKKKWNEIPREVRERFWNYTLIVEMLTDVSSASIKDTFERINRNSRKLEPQEIRHARYDGWFINAVESEANDDDWKKIGIVTAARAKRMSDVQFLSELFAIEIKQKLNGFDQDWLDELHAEYEEPEMNGTFSQEEFKNSFQEKRDIIIKLLDLDPKISTFVKVNLHLYTLWGLLSLESNEDLNTEIFASSYRSFMEKVVAAIKAIGSDNFESDFDQAVRGYAVNSRGASTDLSLRQNRHQHLLTAMSGVDGISDENR